MNYQAFTNESLTMMYHGVRGALAADDALNDLGTEGKFRVREPRSGNCMLMLSKPKCSCGECFLRSSIGLKVRRCFF